MKKILLFAISLIFVISNYLYAANIMHTFDDAEWKNIQEEWAIMDKGFDEDLNDGPGYDILKDKYDTTDFNIILDNVDKDFGISTGEASIIPKSKSTRVGSNGSGKNKLSMRERMIEMQISNNERKEEKKEEKGDDSSNDHGEGSMKVKISLNVDKNHPENPTPGYTYSKTYLFYTDQTTLGDVLREHDLTSDSGFLSEFDGINGSYTIEESYSSDYKHGTWEGYSFMIYKNGKQTNVGMEDLKIIDGCSYKIKAEKQRMSW